MGQKIAVLVGAAPVGSESEKLLGSLRNKENYTIAVDAGIGFFIRNGITPDCFVGDMDSTHEMQGQLREGDMDDLKPGEYKEEYVGDTRVVRVSTVKDDTDMALAVRCAIEAGCESADIFGGIGGRREDHTFANIQLMLFHAKRGVTLRMYSENTVMQVLYNGGLEYDEDQRGMISVMALSDVASGVKIKGLRYEYEGDMVNDVALGVSNEFCGRPSRVSVNRGALLIVREN